MICRKGIHYHVTTWFNITFLITNKGDDLCDSLHSGDNIKMNLLKVNAYNQTFETLQICAISVSRIPKSLCEIKSYIFNDKSQFPLSVTNDHIISLTGVELSLQSCPDKYFSVLKLYCLGSSIEIPFYFNYT